jgi:hypothetical protein
VTIPNYLATFRRAVRELERNEINEKSTPLISHNSLISHPSPSENTELLEIKERISRTKKEKRIIAPEGGAREKSEISEKRVRSFPFAEALDALERCRPEYVEPERWQQCLIDAQRFLASWGDKALALGWTESELFGLHDPPARPHPSYCRLSRYEPTGLLWLLRGRRVVALTADTAAIETASGVVVYRKHRKPALGPLGDSLDDFVR